jgi:hypothetical protein
MDRAGSSLSPSLPSPSPSPYQMGGYRREKNPADDLREGGREGGKEGEREGRREREGERGGPRRVGGKGEIGRWEQVRRGREKGGEGTPRGAAGAWKRGRVRKGGRGKEGEREREGKKNLERSKLSKAMYYIILHYIYHNILHYLSFIIMMNSILCHRIILQPYHNEGAEEDGRHQVRAVFFADSNGVVDVHPSMYTCQYIYTYNIVADCEGFVDIHPLVRIYMKTKHSLSLSL